MAFVQFQRAAVVGLVVAVAAAIPLSIDPVSGQQTATGSAAAVVDDDTLRNSFQQDIQPLLTTYCLKCHNAETMKSGIRLDRLTGDFDDSQLPLWDGILSQLDDEAMPPEDEPQPTGAQRQTLVNWIRQAQHVARNRKRAKNGVVRRLTVAQYRNTLRDLLGLEDDFTHLLPPDAVSADGFLNNEQLLQLSPLLVEAYFNVAELALDRCLVDESSRPVIQNFRVDLGAVINPQPYPEPLILGALSSLLANQDFTVTQLTPSKSFDFEPFRMQTKFRFIEGYQGNDTVRDWREYDSIYHAVFACMRGTMGYAKGLAYQTVPEGLLLRPAVPSAELFQVESTYGPKANFKISLRELPDHGRFRVTVKAAKYDDGLLLDVGTPLQDAAPAVSLTSEELSQDASVTIDEPGIYQADVHFQPAEKPNTLYLTLGSRQFAGQLIPSAGQDAGQETDAGAAFLLVRLSAGPLDLKAQYADPTQLKRISLTRLKDDSEAAQRFRTFEQRVPLLGVHLGLRRDCGSTLSPVGPAQPVRTAELQQYVFEGAIRNFPSPDVEKDNVNYLAGIREIGVRSEYTDGRDMPQLLIRSVEFEGPFYDAWPPATHRGIFVDSNHKDDPSTYAREIIRGFAARAFRRQVLESEVDLLVNVWKDSFAESHDFRRSIQDALQVVLTSGQFLFLIEDSQTPEAEPLTGWELASKLSYFLWNTLPDERLYQLAHAGELSGALDSEVERMIQDPRFEQFTREFTTQWLSLDKFDVVEIDRQRYPRLTRDTGTQLRQEPIQFVQHLIRLNLTLKNLVQSDFLMANEVVADYYDLRGRTDSGFEFVAIKHDDEHLGGVITQAAVLSGLSDGREANPVKRGAWLARKLIAEPPDDPPPNVPALPADEGSQLTLRQKLERHRNQEGCAKCHSGIDPWGLPLEQFDAGGRFTNDASADAQSTLPDGTQITDANHLKSYLSNDRIDQVAFSFLKHLASYATGRSLSYQEIELLREQARSMKGGNYLMQDMIRFIVNSPLFLEK